MVIRFGKSSALDGLARTRPVWCPWYCAFTVLEGENPTRIGPCAMRAMHRFYKEGEREPERDPPDVYEPYGV